MICFTLTLTIYICNRPKMNENENEAHKWYSFVFNTIH